MSVASKITTLLDDYSTEASSFDDVSHSDKLSENKGNVDASSSDDDIKVRISNRPAPRRTTSVRCKRLKSDFGQVPVAKINLFHVPVRNDGELQKVYL
jgi:hypothetical protein